MNKNDSVRLTHLNVRSPSESSCLGKVRRCGLAGEGVSLGLGFKVPKETGSQRKRTWDALGIQPGQGMGHVAGWAITSALVSIPVPGHHLSLPFPRYQLTMYPQPYKALLISS